MNQLEASFSDLPIPTRPLGRTGVEVSIFGLGGEGVLRTFDRTDEARAVIERALDVGVTYFDSARAYAGSEGYYGASLGRRREKIFLTSKAFERTKRNALEQLDQNASQRLPARSEDASRVGPVRLEGPAGRPRSGRRRRRGRARCPAVARDGRRSDEPAPAPARDRVVWRLVRWGPRRALSALTS